MTRRPPINAGRQTLGAVEMSDPMLYTDEENWSGGLYELAIELGETNDQRLQRAPHRPPDRLWLPGRARRQWSRPAWPDRLRTFRRRGLPPAQRHSARAALGRIPAAGQWKPS